MGITITMYFDDHPPPHFHARAAGASAKIRIDTFEAIASNLPPREMRLILTWARLHAFELRVNWRRAREGSALTVIESLQ